MRRTYAKLITLLLMLALVLTGCNLVDVNELEVIAQQRAEVEKNYATPIATYEGGEVTKFDVMANFYSMYTYYEQIYSLYYGMSLDSATVDSLMENTIENEILARLLSAEFDARGLTLEMTEEEIKAEADETWESNFASYLESAEGDTDEIKNANAELNLYIEGVTQDFIYNQNLMYYKATAMQEALEAEVTELTEEELQEAYEARVAEDEESYSALPSAIEEVMLQEDGYSCWMPEDYRTVKHILVIPEEDVLQAVIDARNAYSDVQDDLKDLEDELAALEGDEVPEDARTADEIQADIDAKNAEMAELEKTAEKAVEDCIASVQDKLDAIYAELEAGESFDSVMAAYGEDPGMQADPAMTTGYYVGADSYMWDSRFVQGAMELKQVGDYSETPVVTSSGVHIIFYDSDVKPGAVALDEVRDLLYAEALEEAKTSHYEDTVTSMLESVNVVYDLDAWNAATED